MSSDAGGRSPQAVFEAAVGCVERGDLAGARRLLDPLATRFPEHSEVLRLLGIVALQAGDAATAVGWLERAVAAAPGSAPAWCNLGSARRATGDEDAARQAFERALRSTPDMPEALNGLGALAQAAGEAATARDYYAGAMRSTGPASAAGLNLAALELAAGRSQRALALLDAALRAAPGHAPARRLRALALIDAGDLAAARAAAEPFASDAEVQHRLGVLLEQQGDWPAALACQEQALAADPRHGPALSDRLFLRRRLCRWEDIDADRDRAVAAVQAGIPGIKPFTLLSEDVSAATQQAAARLWARRFAAAPRRPARRPGTDPLTVGFLSNGFREHPTACLVAELFEQLPHPGFRWVAYAREDAPASPLRRRIAAALDAFTPVDGQDAAAIADRIADDGVDVLVDLRGYGGGAITEVFARRAAPVQVNWLAYPGTLGAPFMDYVVLDDVVAPATVRACFDEAPVVLPHCFQPSDTTRAFADRIVDRRACGLPERAFVLASFNNSYKLSPAMFRTWMAILRRVPDAVLWLLDGPSVAGLPATLRAAAAAAGVVPERLHFLAKQPHLDYLARYACADLFLDTLPYNAHTTAGDALFAGCPVLSCPGRTFAGRVAASLLAAVGLDEFVVPDPAAYEERAVALAGPARAELAAARERLTDQRSALPLFQPARLASELACAFRYMVGRTRNGEAASGFAVLAGGEGVTPLDQRDA